MSNALSEHWQYTTICIENDTGQIAGTGVLVANTPKTRTEHGSLEIDWKNPEGPVYLVTARHVLGDNRSHIETTIMYNLHYNSKGAAGIVAARAEFTMSNDPPNWAIHPDRDVDIAVLDVTQWLSSCPDAIFCVCPLSEIANPVNLLQTECEAGDDVFVIGYPLTLRQGRTNLPIFRKGVLATSPSRALDDNGKPLRGFLVDGAIMPGSSGSPVVSLSTKFHSGDLSVTPHRTLLLGIVAQEWGRGELSKYDSSGRGGAPVPIEGYANLGFAHSASAIIEVIVSLGHYSVQDCLQLDHDQNWSSALNVGEWCLELNGAEVDAITAERIMTRLHRDRMRTLDHFVALDEHLDIPELLGPVHNSAPKPAYGLVGPPRRPGRQ